MEIMLGFELMMHNYFRYTERQLEIVETAERVSMKLKNKHSDFFFNMCKRLRFTDCDVHNRTIYFNIADELFETGINWGRIIKFIVFSGYVMEHIESDIISERMSIYIDEQLNTWIAEVGGSSNFIEFFKETNEPKKKFKNL